MKLKWRVFRMRSKGANIGKGVKIYGKITTYGRLSNLKIGNGCTINNNVSLGVRGGIQIGNDVRISPNVIIISSGLNLNEKPRKHFEAPIVIENNVWIAVGAIISAGVKIGENSVIGAGSVIVKDVPKNSFYGGIPGRLIKSIEN